MKGLKTKQTKQTKTLKDNITSKDFDFLINYTKADPSIREKRRNTLLNIFWVLKATGIRLNEMQNIEMSKINELIETRKTKIFSNKTNSEKYIYISSAMQKKLKSIFKIKKKFCIVKEITGLIIYRLYKM